MLKDIPTLGNENHISESLENGSPLSSICKQLWEPIALNETLFVKNTPSLGQTFPEHFVLAQTECEGLGDGAITQRFIYLDDGLILVDASILEPGDDIRVSYIDKSLLAHSLVNDSYTSIEVLMRLERLINISTAITAGEKERLMSEFAHSINEIEKFDSLAFSDDSSDSECNEYQEHLIMLIEDALKTFSDVLSNHKNSDFDWYSL